MVITEHADAHPIYENSSLGIEFRMSNQWFTLLYPCSARPPERTVAIEAEQDGKTVNYTSNSTNQVISSGGKCIAAQAKSDGLITQLHLGEGSSKGLIWKRE